MAARVREEHVEDEDNRRRRALDIQENRPDPLERVPFGHTRAAGGTYEGPRHTG